VSAQDWITVVDVCHELGVAPERRLTLAVGRTIANEYRSRYGMPPRYELRTKTRSKGTHCFAVYPPEWRERITRLIGAHAEVPA